MRILHLDPDDIDNPLSGGGPVRTLEIYRRMAARHEITILTPTFPGSTPEQVRDGIRYVRLGRKVGDHGSSHHITYLASLPSAVRRFDYDLLVEDTMPPASATWVPLFRRRRVPFIGSVQWWNAHEYTRRLKLPFHWGQTKAIRMYPNLVVLTEQMKKTIASVHPGANCRVIPNGVDAGLFEIEPAIGGFILYLGRIDVEAKGLDVLLEAMSLIEASARPLLVIAGFGHEQERLTQIVNEYQLSPWIERIGKVDAAERARLLKWCRFMVMPSRYETFGMTIAEANAAGKVSVVFDAWPMNEVAAPVCPRVVPFDAQALANSIKSLLAEDADTLLRLGQMCRDWSAERYNWDDVARRQEAFYEEVVEYHARQRSAESVL